MKKTLLATVLITLAACGGSGGSDGGSNNTPTGSNETPQKTPTGVVINKDLKLEITGSNNTATVAKSTKSEINISGNANLIYVQSNISTLDIVGNDNTFEISNGVTIDDCNVMGDSNKLIKPNGLTVQCEIQGKNNLGFN